MYLKNKTMKSLKNFEQIYHCKNNVKNGMYNLKKKCQINKMCGILTAINTIKCD